VILCLGAKDTVLVDTRGIDCVKDTEDLASNPNKELFQILVMSKSGVSKTDCEDIGFS